MAALRYIQSSYLQLKRNYSSFNLHNNGNLGFTNLVSACSNKHAPGSISKTTSFAQLIESLIERRNLTEDEAEESLDFLLRDANEALISAFLVLLRAKGETYEEGFCGNWNYMTICLQGI